MKSRVLQGKEANLFAPFIAATTLKVITPIYDTVISQKILGNLFIFEGHSFDKPLLKTGTYAERALSVKQKEIGIKGAFLFIGTNGEFFHHLIDNRVMGKYSCSDIMIDKEYSSCYTYEFVTILRKYLIG